MDSSPSPPVCESHLQSAHSGCQAASRGRPGNLEGVIVQSLVPHYLGFVSCIEGSFEAESGSLSGGVEFRIAWGGNWASLFVRLRAAITVRFPFEKKTFRVQHSFLLFLSVANDPMVYQAGGLSGDPDGELQLRSFYDPVKQEVVLVCDNGDAEWSVHVVPGESSFAEVVRAQAHRLPLG